MALRAETLAEEEPLLRALIPAQCLETWCDTFVSVLIIRTAHARLRMRMLLPAAYPDAALRFELSSDTLPPVALKRLTRQCEKDAVARKGRPQLVAAAALVKDAVESNMFLYSLGELRAVSALAEEHAAAPPLPAAAGGAAGGGAVAVAGGGAVGGAASAAAAAAPPAPPASAAAAAAAAAATAAGGDTAPASTAPAPTAAAATTTTTLTVLSTNPTTGVLKLKLGCGRYVCSVTLTVPAGYPEAALTVSLGATTSTTMPEPLRRMIEPQANEIARKCSAGYTVEQARRAANPITMPSHMLKYEERFTLNNATLKTLTSDVRTLKVVSQLRGAGAATATGGPQWQKSIVNERAKAARRELARLSKSEGAKEAAAEAAAREEQAAELAALIAKPSGEANASLLAVVEFLAHDFAWKLPRETCQVCARRVMPADPLELDALLADARRDHGTSRRGRARAKEAEQHKPIRVFCGHWLHWGCLDQALTTPPFGKACSLGCGRALYHPDWPSNVAVLEKAWTMKEARRREIEEVTDFMGC